MPTTRNSVVISLFPERPDAGDVIPTATTDSTAVGSSIEDPDLDAVRFGAGFDAASSDLDRFPTAWASHHASLTLERGVPGDHDPSYTRGYRAALYGFLRHARR